MRRGLVIGLLALAVAAPLAGATSAATTRSSGTLEVRVSLGLAWRFSDSYCPPGAPDQVECVGFRGSKEVPGLGRVTERYVKTLGEDNVCKGNVTLFRSLVLEVAGKGAIDLALDGGPHCGPPAPAENGPYALRVSGGSGVYAGASGSIEWRSSTWPGSPGCECGQASDSLAGTLSVPGLEFDLTAPVISGARSISVRASKRAKRVRVRYALRAADAVDGSVRVSCTPRSGSFFKLGRTKVRCAATDSSANTTRSQFTVTVRR